MPRTIYAREFGGMVYLIGVGGSPEFIAIPEKEAKKLRDFLNLFLRWKRYHRLK